MCVEYSFAGTNICPCEDEDEDEDEDTNLGGNPLVDALCELSHPGQLQLKHLVLHLREDRVSQLSETSKTLRIDDEDRSPRHGPGR